MTDADNANAQRLFDELHDSHADLQALASRLGMTLQQLGQWMADRDNSVKVDALLRFEDARLQMLLNRYRRAAAANLVRIASSDQPGELARKACLDLLKTEIGTQRARFAARSRAARAAKSSDPPSDLPVSSVEEILKALGDVGDRHAG